MTLLIIGFALLTVIMLVFPAVMIGILIYHDRKVKRWVSDRTKERTQPLLDRLSSINSKFQELHEAEARNSIDFVDWKSLEKEYKLALGFLDSVCLEDTYMQPHYIKLIETLIERIEKRIDDDSHSLWLQ